MAYSGPVIDVRVGSSLSPLSRLSSLSPPLNIYSPLSSSTKMTREMTWTPMESSAMR